MIKHKSVEKVIYLHSISINHAKLLIISITANTFGQKRHSSIFQATYMAVWLEKRPFSMAGSREEAWAVQRGRGGKGRHGTPTSKINRRHSNKQRAIQTIPSIYKSLCPHSSIRKKEQRMKPHEKHKEPLPGVCHGGAL